MGSEALAPARPVADARIPGETEALTRWPELRPFMRDIVAEFGDRIDAVLLYGSRARGEEHGGSDYDLSIVFRDEFPHYDMNGRFAVMALGYAREGRRFEAFPIVRSRLVDPEDEDFYARNIVIDGIALVGTKP